MPLVSVRPEDRVAALWSVKRETFAMLASSPVYFWPNQRPGTCFLGPVEIGHSEGRATSGGAEDQRTMLL